LITRNDSIKLIKVYFDDKFGKSKFILEETYVPPSGKVLDVEGCSHLIDTSFDMWLIAGRCSSRFEPILAKIFA